jgi:hypothetical protein
MDSIKVGLVCALFAVATLAGCDNTKKEYASFAAKVNPVLAELHTLDAKVFPDDTKGKSDGEIFAQSFEAMQACHDAEPVVERLVDATNGEYKSPVVTSAAHVLHDAADGFGSAMNAGCGGDPINCLQACLDGWAKIAGAVDALNEDAAKNGATITRVHVDKK